MSVATGGPMQNEKSSATPNASNVARQGVCHVTPLNTTVTTTAAKTFPVTIRSQYLKEQFMSIVVAYTLREQRVRRTANRPEGRVGGWKVDSG